SATGSDPQREPTTPPGLFRNKLLSDYRANHKYRVTVVDATNLAVVMEMAAVAEIKTTIPITDCLFN
ncbi:MAG: hypothetical protein II567_08120, partial [Candidatus Riflebacteria bacterium]|nr:hypothetical protein [Candidatus Riflebacteria bacterium]